MAIYAGYGLKTWKSKVQFQRKLSKQPLIEHLWSFFAKMYVILSILLQVKTKQILLFYKSPDFHLKLLVDSSTWAQTLLDGSL